MVAIVPTPTFTVAELVVEGVVFVVQAVEPVVAGVPEAVSVIA